NGELPAESSDFVQRLSRLELERITVDSEPLARLARSIVKSEVIQDDNDPTISKLRNRLPSILVRLRIIESKEDYEQFVRHFYLNSPRQPLQRPQPSEICTPFRPFVASKTSTRF